MTTTKTITSWPINLEHGQLTWDAGAARWELSWVDCIPSVKRIEHRAAVDAPFDATLETLSRKAAACFTRDLDPMTGTVAVLESKDFGAKLRGTIELIRSSVSAVVHA